MVADAGCRAARGIAALLVAVIASGCGGSAGVAPSSTTPPAGQPSATAGAAPGATTAGTPATAPASTLAPGPATAAAASVPTASGTCDGPPIHLMTITSVTGQVTFPAVAEGAEAAAAAANASCAAGAPLALEVCDDRFDAAIAAGCGERAVEEGIVALVAPISPYGDAFHPVVFDAGIPSFGNAGTGSVEQRAPLSFPLVNAATGLVGAVRLARSAGATSVALVLPDPGPALQEDVVAAQSASGGLRFDGAVRIPVFETVDYAEYATEAAASDAVIVAVPRLQIEHVLRGLVLAGVDFASTTVIAVQTATQEIVDAFAGAVDGLLVATLTWPLHDASHEGIAHYVAELEAVGATLPPSPDGLFAWSAVHALADVLSEVPSPDATTLAQHLSTASVERPELVPTDYSAPAFGDDPLLGDLRVFQRQYLPGRVIDGTIVPLTTTFVDVDEDIAL